MGGRRPSGLPAWVKRDAEARSLAAPWPSRVAPTLTRASAAPQVEVQGWEEGFFGSWYLARVSSVDESSGVVTLRYTELLQEDGTAETETLRGISRLRPPLARHFLQGGARRPDAVRVRSAALRAAAASRGR